MKLLVILISNTMNSKFLPNIQILNNYLTDGSDIQVEYCGISSIDDFNNYNTVIQFKYKIVNSKKQFSKLCDFISDTKSLLDYDWYIKIRPDIKLCDPIQFTQLSDTAINARARVYNGPNTIMYGMSVNGKGYWSNIGDCFYNVYEKDIILDDNIFIFHNNVIHQGAFDKVNIDEKEIEWTQCRIWNQRSIPFQVIGLNVINTTHNVSSGHVLPLKPQAPTLPPSSSA